MLEAILLHLAANDPTLELCQVRIESGFAVMQDCDNYKKVYTMIAMTDGSYQWNEDGWDYRTLSRFSSAELGQAADVATTVYAIAELGAVEANPIGLAILPVKVGVHYYAETLEQDECAEAKRFWGSAGWGAAAANTAVVVAGVSNPATLAAGVVAAVIAYSVTDPVCEINMKVTYDRISL